MTIVAATDGSALGNPGPAGWAWYIDDNQWAAGGWPHGTNNMGELTAVLELLRATAGSDDDLAIYCDSQYVINTITKWMKGWKAKGWKKKDGKPPENLEIIKGLDAAMAGRSVRFTWVKGHAGHELNEAADVRAQAAAAAHQSGRTPDAGPGFATVAPATSARVTDAATPPAASPASAGPANPAAATVPAVAQVAPASLFDEFDLDGSPSDSGAVVALERELLSDETRSDTGRLAELLAPGWSEIAASGRVVTREELLLDGLAPVDATLDVMQVSHLGDQHLLLTYRATDSRGSSLRSSVWVNQQGHWRQVFHQGTPQT